ncbi:alpha/beta fold hydrolase [Acidisoma sp. C75]
MHAASSPAVAELVPPARKLRRGRVERFSPRLMDGVFTMPDGARLPYREWLPTSEPEIVLLALHGINDSADGWDAPARHLAEAGIGMVAPDQRGFGAATGRGQWFGTERLVEDARHMLAAVRARFPRARLFLAGESMGAAILMVLAAREQSLPVEGFVLSAPAVWGRREMALLFRLSLRWGNRMVPWLRLRADRLGIKPTDNQQALRRMQHPSLGRPSASIRALSGLADLMDAACHAAGARPAPTLFLYGGKDRLVPPHAMAACWRREHAANPDARRFAFYPDGYHLLHRDRAGALVTRDVVQWLLAPAAPLPSGADRQAAEWLARIAA